MSASWKAIGARNDTSYEVTIADQTDLAALQGCRMSRMFLSLSAAVGGLAKPAPGC